MRTPSLISGFLLAAYAVLSACSQQEESVDTSSQVLATVAGETITERDFSAALQRLGGDSQTLTLDEWRQQFQILIDTHLLLATARERGLG